MNQETARNLLNNLMWTIQKARSNIFETVGTDKVAQAIYNDLHPHVLGENAPLLLAVDKALGKPKIEPMDLYNLFYMANKENLLSVTWMVTYSEKMPEPEMTWVTDLMGETND